MPFIHRQVQADRGQLKMAKNPDEFEKAKLTGILLLGLLCLLTAMTEPAYREKHRAFINNFYGKFIKFGGVCSLC
jgi:hypothetical protein